MTVAVLVLNFNGKELLQRYLPSFEAALARSKYSCVLGVVDNQSTDGSVEYLRQQFPGVVVYQAKENRVLCSFNEVVAYLDQEVILLMNNDIRVEADFIDPLIEPFLKHKDVFFVTPRCLSEKLLRYEGNRTKAMIRYGMFWSSAIYPGYERGIDKPGLTFQGGFGAFDRKKFLELEGYDDLYLPGRLEDADLCFRAFKRGWRCLYEPRSVVTHEGGVSFHKRFGFRQTQVINWRNTFLFMLKNLSDRITFFKLLFWLPLRVVYSLLMLKPELTVGLWRALPLVADALARRRQLKKAGLLRRISDRKIFEMTGVVGL